MAEVERKKSITANLSDETLDSVEGSQVVTVSKERLLIQLVQEEQFLYNPKHDTYRNILLKDKKWKEIGECIDWTDLQCKRKWKALRDQYARELKHLKLDPGAKTKWKYFNDLEFLKKYTLKRTHRPRTKMMNPNESGFVSKPMNMKTDTDWEYYDVVLDENEVTDDSANQEQPDESQADGEDPLYVFLRIEGRFERELIALIREAEILYSCSHPHYRNVQKKAEKWNEIAKRTKKTVKQCRLKWKALRDQYCREYRRVQTLSNPDSASKWKHYDALCFLEKFIKKRKFILPSSNSIDQKIEMKTEAEEVIFEAEDYIMADDCEEIGDNELVHTISEYVESTPEEVQDSGYTTVIEEAQIEQMSKDIEEPIDQHPNDDEDEQAHHQQQAVEMIESFGRGNSISSSAANTSVQYLASNDEVDAFFQTVSMKVRNARLTDLSFTDLQINILKVIGEALRNNNH